MEPQVEARQSKVTARWTFLSLHLYLRSRSEMSQILKASKSHHSLWPLASHISTAKTPEVSKTVIDSEHSKTNKPCTCIHTIYLTNLVSYSTVRNFSAYAIPSKF